MKKQKIIEHLSKISKTLSSKENDYKLLSHCKDWRGRYSNKCICVVFPKTEGEITKILKFCNLNRIKVIPQGGNTSLVGGATPNFDEKEVIINLSKFNKIIEIDEINMTATAEAGVIIDDLESEVNKFNLMLPIKLASSGSCQVGGVVATNAGGINVVKYGSVRSNLISIGVILPNGEKLDLGRKVKKDNTGYDLKNLFISSEGTLGVITKAIFQLYPIPKEYLNCFIATDSIDNAIQIFTEVQKKFSDSLESCELIPHIAFDLCLKHKLIKNKIFKHNSKFYILCKFISIGDDKYFLNYFSDFMENTKLINDLLIAQNEKQAYQFWNFRELMVEAQKLEGKLLGYDISIPIDKIKDFSNNSMKQIEKLVPGIRLYCFGHLGDSNLHFNLIEPLIKGEKIFSYEEKISKIILSEVIKYSGSISAEHGIGRLKKSDFLDYKKNNEIVAMKNIKKIFDPNKIMNIGKLFDV